MHDITKMYSVLPPYWILFGLLSDIAIICLHIPYYVLIIVEHVSFTLVTSIGINAKLTS